MATVPTHPPALPRELPLEPLAVRRRTERLAGQLLMLAAVTAAIPAVGVLGLLAVRGAPALSFTFLFGMPVAGMTAGGILPAIVGTVWLVG
ncbi:MAG: hypothetical protein ABMA64_05630, partial [Myxococcota bacterium]